MEQENNLTEGMYYSSWNGNDVKAQSKNKQYTFLTGICGKRY